VDGSSTTPPPNTGVWTTWSFKQYDWTASVPGIPGSSTDLNVFNGDMTAFNSLMGCTSTVVKPTNLQYSFAVYPNPASGNFRIDYPAMYGEVVLTIYDINGKTVFTQTMNGSSTFETNDLPEGVYNLSMTWKGEVVNKRLIIAK
jgi:hypothetical protein